MLARFRLPMVAIVEEVARAIAKFEGFYHPHENSLAQRNNNPGNLRSWGGFDKSHKGFVKFPNLAEGWRALRLQIWKDLVGRKLTLIEMMRKYAPAEDNNKPEQYARFVAGHLNRHGILVDTDEPVFRVSAEFENLGPHAIMKYPGHPNDPTPDEVYGD